MKYNILVQAPWGDKVCTTQREVIEHSKKYIPDPIQHSVIFHGATIYWGVLKLTRVLTPELTEEQKLRTHIHCLAALQHESHLEETP